MERIAVSNHSFKEKQNGINKGRVHEGESLPVFIIHKPIRDFKEKHSYVIIERSDVVDKKDSLSHFLFQWRRRTHPLLTVFTPLISSSS